MQWISPESNNQRVKTAKYVHFEGFPNSDTYSTSKNKCVKVGIYLSGKDIN